MTAPSLTLFLPPRRDAALRLPALETLLARGDRVRGLATEPQCRLLQLCGIEPAGEEAPPVGPLCALADGGSPGDDYWLRADPVHMVADHSRVFVGAVGADLAITADEAGQLAAEFNDLFTADGLTLLPLAAGRWYLRVANAPRLTTAAPQAGVDVAAQLPRGADALAWHAALTEVQMLFHQSTVNTRRRERGLPVVNGVWPWGGGRLPVPVTLPWQRVYADDCFTCGLARAGGAECLPLPARLEALSAERNTLVVFDADMPWPALEADWLAPLLAALRTGRWGELIMHPAATTLALRLDAKAARRWWRRRRPVAAYWEEAER